MKDLMAWLAVEEEARARTARWLERFVIGLRLCPFAAAPYRAGLVRLHVSKARTPDEAITDLLDELSALLELEPHERSTTLLITPHALADYMEFIETVHAIDALLEESQADAFVQLAHFHPDYLFKDEPREGVSHYTNRSPYPTLHLLRSEEVADAVVSSPDIDDLPTRNVALMEELGLAHILALRASCGDA